ncbi:alpha-mannosyltransferase [Orrella marina]|uniref:Alpha-mannosyltransferase n=2 Tax=Orrella marina TaxID=2163011 RepID=A0A2R4XPJ4_9BURK|nr:alpha-mannosyltransferase [Orrella marina]
MYSSDQTRPRRILIVTDAWAPQVNGVVRTIDNTRRELERMGVHVQILSPQQFRTIPCPTYPDIKLSLTTPARVTRMIEDLAPDALHIATEGPLGWCARRGAVLNGWHFTTAYHTRFPEYVRARTGLPVGASYRLLARFHQRSAAVMVPSLSMVSLLHRRGFGRIAHWGRGVDHDVFYPRISQSVSPNKSAPVFLYAGRLAVEKNIEAFLSLDLPGVKWVAGDGPAAASLKARYPDARFLGMLDPDDLAQVYSESDVFVFPSLTDTFGLVMAEAMACGLPVAAFPAPGPLDVVGKSGAGVLDQNLRQACLACLKIPRSAALERAAQFNWRDASLQFLLALRPMRAASVAS